GGFGKSLGNSSQIGFAAPGTILNHGIEVSGFCHGDVGDHLRYVDHFHQLYVNLEPTREGASVGQDLLCGLGSVQRYQYPCIHGFLLVICLMPYARGSGKLGFDERSTIGAASSSPSVLTISTATIFSFSGYLRLKKSSIIRSMSLSEINDGPPRSYRFRSFSFALSPMALPLLSSVFPLRNSARNMPAHMVDFIPTVKP